jgi:hypothetical protein
LRLFFVGQGGAIRRNRTQQFDTVMEQAKHRNILAIVHKKITQSSYASLQSVILTFYLPVLPLF